MKTEVGPSHVAVLVPSVRKAADYLHQFKFDIGEVETFEETREIYVQSGEKNSVVCPSSRRGRLKDKMSISKIFFKKDGISVYDSWD